MTQRGDELLQSRQAKLAALRERGVDPYPPRFRRSHTAKSAVARFEKAEREGKTARATVAGRIMRMRGMGGASFIDVEDSTGAIQLYLQADALGAGYELLADLDLGDFVGARGELMRTRRGEISVQARRFTLLAKALRPPPDDYYGLRDTEQRYRRRYLDLIVNRDVHDVMRKRSAVIVALRRFFDARGFLEVETPTLVPVPAGAMAEPFATEHHALRRTLYLRIATELYLKRLIVGGMDKVYEIGRVFRNEGIDRDHNPEFTLLESYEAYADYRAVMRMVERLVPYVAQRAIGATTIERDGARIDLRPPWPRLDLREAVRTHSGIDIDDFPDATALAARMREAGVHAAYEESRGRLIDKLVGQFVEPRLIQPTFLVDYPAEMSPLAKLRADDPRYAERFEAFAGGMEIANSFTELNDPVQQRARMEEQEELRRRYQGEELDRVDDDYILALEHGMPPTGGLGIGVDRLVMLLTGQRSIRDVALFPQVRSIDE
ncbi:MAG: lysine--tRNA ligase [Chloroflexota bacterium]|nr:lysine--tRNA ligase [Chloroflexota bacterium]